MVDTSTAKNPSQNNPAEIVRKIRLPALGAARQYLDAVLIYEVFSETTEETLRSSAAAWTIIGAYFVPSERTTTVGYANALFIDIRNGYPYATASASATKKDVGVLVGHWDWKILCLYHALRQKRSIKNDESEYPREYSDSIELRRFDSAGR